MKSKKLTIEPLSALFFAQDEEMDRLSRELLASARRVYHLWVKNSRSTSISWLSSTSEMALHRRNAIAKYGTALVDHFALVAQYEACQKRLNSLKKKLLALR